jgi:hypothetical protein
MKQKLSQSNRRANDCQVDSQRIFSMQGFLRADVGQES